MISVYDPQTKDDRKNVIKEIMQEIALCGLSKVGFFEEAAFYGGTALRIFYGLDRFSEDLDFALLSKNEAFDLSRFCEPLETFVKSFGINVKIETKVKSIESDIKSAFLKANTIEQFLLFYPNDLVTGINKNELIKIKFEVDTMPPGGATYEVKYALLPVPYAVNIYDEASLFSGKIHAVICRSWRSRVKGRDLYDYLFYLSRHSKFNMELLKAKLTDSRLIGDDKPINVDDVKNMLINRFDQIDFEEAKMDVMNFIHDASVLDIWSKEFFVSVTSNLQAR